MLHQLLQGSVMTGLQQLLAALAETHPRRADQLQTIGVRFDPQLAMRKAQTARYGYGVNGLE